jgi:hypothetical protein
VSSLRDAAEDHLVMRRALGFKLTTWGRHLRSFIDYCETHHADHLTTELALAWPSKPQAVVVTRYRSRRLMVVRILTRHLKTLDPATEIRLRMRAAPLSVDRAVSVFTAGDHCADRRGGVGSRRHFGLPRTRR